MHCERKGVQDKNFYKRLSHMAKTGKDNRGKLELQLMLTQAGVLISENTPPTLGGVFSLGGGG
jgi:hypothetical protein